MSNQMTLPGFESATSSPGSGDGPTRSVWLDGLPGYQSGPLHFRVSLSLSQVRGKELMTRGTSGLCSENSSPSAALQRSLESKLLQVMGESGSLEYELTWKRWDMPSGPPICALRASARRTSDNGCIGWRSPNAMPPNRGGLQSDPEAALARIESGNQLNLDDQVTLTGWPTSAVQNATGGGRREWDPRGFNTLQGVALTGWPTPNTMTGGQTSRGRDRKDEPLLGGAAQLAGYPTPCQQDGPKGGPSQGVDRLPGSVALTEWATPTVRDHKDGIKQDVPENSLLGCQVWSIGQTSTSSPAEIQEGKSSSGVSRALNPAFSRWLMGYPEEWDLAAIRAHRSIRTRPRKQG